MATISVTNQPSAIAAAENPMLVTFSTAASGTTESYALTTIKINNGVTADVDWVQIVMNQPVLKGVRFNASSSPAAPTDFLSSGYTFIFTPVTFTNQEIAASLGEAIRTDPNISTYYSTYVSGDTVYINAKLANQRLCLATGTTVDQGNNIITASSYSKFTITTVSEGSSTNQGDLESRYAIWADLFIDNTPTTTPYRTDLPITSMQYVTTYKKNWIYGDNTVDFDLGTVLKSYCTLPDIGPIANTGSTVYSDGIWEGPFRGYFRNYKVQYGDYKAVGFKNVSVTLSGFPNMIKQSKGFITNKWVCPASFPYNASYSDETSPMMFYYSGDTTTTSASRPLTHSPSAGKKVFIAQEKEWLYFMNKLRKLGNTSYTLQIGITYTYIDNTTSSTTLNNTSAFATTNDRDGLWRVNVSPTTVGIDSDGEVGGKKVRSYSVLVRTTAATGFMLAKTYVIDEIQPATGMEVIWLNEFGCHDTFYFGGNITSGVERDQSEQVKNVPYDFPEGFEYNSAYDTSVYNTYAVSTSYIDEDHFNWLKGLLNSNKVYVYDATNERIKYVTVTDYTYEKDTVRNQYVMNVTLRDTIFDNNVSV